MEPRSLEREGVMEPAPEAPGPVESSMVSFGLAPMAESVPWQGTKTSTEAVSEPESNGPMSESVLDRFLAPWVVMGRDIHTLGRGSQLVVTGNMRDAQVPALLVDKDGAAPHEETVLDRFLAPWVLMGRDIYTCGRDLLEAVLAYTEVGEGEALKAFGFHDTPSLKWHARCCDDEEDDVSVGAPLVLRVGHELAVLSALLSIAGGMPAVDPGLALASANLGPFTGTTYTLSVLATSVLTMSVPALLQKHPEVRQRRGFRAAAAAAATAAAGQIAFMTLSLTPSIAFANMLPGVTVSDFMQPMQNPFMVVHLISHSMNLPLMNLTLGRLAGRSVADMSTCHYSTALYSISVILSAATKEAYFRWPLLILGGLCLKKGLADLEEVSKFVETLAPRNPTTQVWTQKHKICPFVAHWGFCLQ
ncbi:unnamed protein product [Symbiodinium sp. CCMP2456]|nr:unnamed protein product [Symbiodinium sp. CCMP2456]